MLPEQTVSDTGYVKSFVFLKMRHCNCANMRLQAFFRVEYFEKTNFLVFIKFFLSRKSFWHGNYRNISQQGSDIISFLGLSNAKVYGYYSGFSE